MNYPGWSNIIRKFLKRQKRQNRKTDVFIEAGPGKMYLTVLQTEENHEPKRENIL